MDKKGIIAATVFGLTMIGTAAWGQESAAETSELDAIIVSADRVPTVAREVSQNVIVIGEEEIKKSAANSVADLLKQKGIQVYYDGAEGYGNEGLVIRGGRSSMHGFDVAGDILVLVDGHRSGTDSISQLELKNTARIEVIRGPGAVQYGAAAMGGVVNVITKRGSEKTEAGLETGWGSFGEYRGSGYFSSRTGPLDYSLGASYFTRDDYNIGGGAGRYENSDVRHRTRYNANLGWNFDDDLQRLGLSVQGSNSVDAGVGDDGRDTRQNRSNYNLDFSYDGRTEDGSKNWLARYFRGEVNYDLNRTISSRNQNRAGQADNGNEYQGAQAQLGWDFGRFQVVGGADWMSYDFDQNQMGEAASDDQRNRAQSTFDNIGGFLMAKLHLLEERNLILSAGLRYDEFDVDVKAYRESGDKHLNTAQSRNTWTPSVGLVYNPVEVLKLRANYAQAFKMPLPRQLTGFTVMMTIPFIGNPELEPEESDNWDIGFDLEHEALSLSATYFDTRYKNMINYRQTLASPYFTGNHYLYYNDKQARINGMELGASFDLGEHFDLAFGLEPYVYWTRLLKFEDQDGWKLPNRARDTVSAGLKFDYDPWGLIINLDATYYGTQYDVTRLTRPSDSPDYGKIIGEYDLKEVGHATIWDLSLSKRLYQSDQLGEVKAKVAIKNIFDKEYMTNVDSWMPGATAYIGLAWDY